MAAKFEWIFMLILLKFLNQTNTADVVVEACKQNADLPYCRNLSNRKAEHLDTPNNPFDETPLEPSTVDPEFQAKFVYDDEEDKMVNDYNDIVNDEILPAEYRRIIDDNRPTANGHQSKTSAPLVQPPLHLFYGIFPHLQPKDSPYFCTQNQYRFQITCQPAKKLRYDLRLFCQDYADICGVPNINLYPSKLVSSDDGRPVGYGQKQQNGHLGFGKSFSLGLGVLPGFEVVNSQGLEIANLPYFENSDGFIVNSGQDIGILGQRIGKGPARTMKTLTRGFPVYSDPRAAVDDKTEKIKALRALGIPPQIGKALSVLSPSSPSRGRKRIGYEPGFGAVNRRTFLATGKTDDDSVVVPGMGEIELVKGIGLGIG